MPARPRFYRRPTAASAFACAAFALTGCAQLLGIDELSSGGDGGPILDGGPGGDASSPVDAALIDAARDLSCADDVLAISTGSVAFDTRGAGDDFTASCVAGASSPDRMLSWTAPATDYYIFDTIGAGFDTVLGLYAECAGEEFACSNDVNPRLESRVVRKFVAGQRALVLIDGNDGSSGQGMLSIQRVECPGVDLEGQSFPLQRSTENRGDDFAFPCGGEGQPDSEFHWIAPQAGLYAFRVTAETFTPALTVLDGARCADPVLSCGGAPSPAIGAEVVRYLEARETVSLIVDGVDGSGTFTLDIVRKAEQTCSEAVLDPAGAPLADRLSERTLAPSCAFPRRPDPSGGVENARDKVYTLPVPPVLAGCFGECTVTIESSQQLALYGLVGDDCSGIEAGCVVAEQVGGQFRASLSFARQQEETAFTAVVAEIDSYTGEYTASVVCDQTCPAASADATGDAP
ncbi:hypothetical protein [Haliangium ochraceum]|uniref:Lipoprotein n=1 Tax=Haliangium ochraceum (strain DSM 14365 / JCM 11303 / SMP-2) TaxID=502025 RepID=D0LMI8_HALO1|nr:hypothetical protein [Haliangium ochraceum]ACY18675.1 hypothetical protein Hoch_6200 [Haliangium ochraceum DSM 14365]